MNWDLIYYLVLSVGVGVLLTLCATMACQHINQTAQYSPYRRSVHYMAGVFGTIAFNFVCSMLLNMVGLGGSKWCTVLDVTTYTPVAAMFSWSVLSLIDDRNDRTLRKQHEMALWVISAAAVTATAIIEDGLISDILFGIVVGLWGIFIAYYAGRIAKTYHRIVIKIDNFYSDDVAQSMRGIRTSVLCFVVVGLFCPLASVLGVDVNAVYVIVSLISYIFLGISILNFRDSYALIHHASEVDVSVATVWSEKELPSFGETEEAISRLGEWRDRKGYRKVGVTIEQISEEMDVPCPMLSKVINHKFGCTFREHINRLRIHDAQEILIRTPQAKIEDVAHQVGYSSAEEMKIYFGRIVGVTPEEWREGVHKLMK